MVVCHKREVEPPYSEAAYQWIPDAKQWGESCSAGELPRDICLTATENRILDLMAPWTVWLKQWNLHVQGQLISEYHLLECIGRRSPFSGLACELLRGTLATVRKITLH